MGTNEARHVHDMTHDLSDVLALELFTAAQALDFRREMLNAARRLAARGDWCALAARIANAPRGDQPQHAQFQREVQALAAALASSAEFRPGAAVRAAHARLRATIPFLHRDRALDGDVARVCALVRERAFAVTVS